ncbi:hypothetical protein [Rhodovulum sp. P5]|uniref:hypothetical protein n=1 Tax=Rhodovulum sp. P5 TaxID=1564506 RepID=UPI001560F953|nr:hypothetical protein [Rhodovulum sp. P5]
MAHALVTGLIVFGVIFGFRAMGWLEGRPKWKQALIVAPAIFIVLFGLNLIWPAGTGTGG